MTKITEIFYGVQCNICKDIFEHPFEGNSFYFDESQAHEYASDRGWQCLGDDHFCPDCHTLHSDEDDRVILKLDRYKKE